MRRCYTLLVIRETQIQKHHTHTTRASDGKHRHTHTHTPPGLAGDCARKCMDHEEAYMLEPSNTAG